MSNKANKIFKQGLINKIPLPVKKTAAGIGTATFMGVSAATSLTGCAPKQPTPQEIFAQTDSANAEAVFGISPELFEEIQMLERQIKRGDEISNSEIMYYTSSTDADLKHRKPKCAEILENLIKLEISRVLPVNADKIKLKEEEDPRNNKDDYYAIYDYAYSKEEPILDNRIKSESKLSESVVKIIDLYFKLQDNDLESGEFNRNKQIKLMIETKDNVEKLIFYGLGIDENGIVDVNKEMKNLGYVLEIKPDGEAYVVAEGKMENLVDNSAYVESGSVIPNPDPKIESLCESLDDMEIGG